MTPFCLVRLELVYSARQMPDTALETAIARLAGVGLRLYAGYWPRLNVCEIQHLAEGSCAAMLAAAVHSVADFHGAGIRELVIIRPGGRDGKDQALVAEFWPPSTPAGPSLEAHRPFHSH